MKTAGFTYKEGNTCIFGTVTLKNDGKVNVSISNAMRFAPSARYKAKALGTAIANADFKHEAVYNFKEVKTIIDSKLVLELCNHTKELKELYIEKTKEYADSHYKWASERNEWTTQKWYDHYNLKYIMKHPGTNIEYPSLESG